MNKNNSSLIQPKVRNALDQARFFFTRKGKKTVFIEGVKDYKMLSPMVNENIRLEVLEGKPNIMFVENKYSQDKFAIQHQYVMIMADVDYDVVINNGISKNVDYNVFCHNKGVVYNDLEIFLVNTLALKKILINKDIDLSTADIEALKSSIEETSRFFGKFRAADEYLKKKIGGRSILNGVVIDDYLIVREMTVGFNSDAFLMQLPLWSNRKECTDDLLLEAERLNHEHSTKWALSNGHDVTKILTAFIEKKLQNKRKHKVYVKPDDIELILRVACDSAEYRQSPMGIALSQFGAI